MTEVDPRQIQWLPLDALVDDPQNPKAHADEQIDASMGRHGVIDLITRDDRTGYIVSGHGRTKALRSQHARGDTPPEGVRVDGDGTWLVPVVTGWASTDDLDAAAVLIKLNRLTELGGWVDESLLALLDDLRAADTPDDAGFTDDDLEALRAHLTPEPAQLTDPDDVPPPPVVPVSQVGDLWLCGPHRVMCGDSTSAADVTTLMAGERADMVFTDPPYGVAYTGGAKKRQALEGDEVGTAIYADSLPHLKQAAADHAALYLWYADAHAAAAAAAAAGYVITAQIIWVKNNAQFVTAAHYKGKHEPCYYAHRKGKTAQWFGENNQVTVWEVPRAHRNDWHPTQKPVALSERAIRNSTAPKDLVLDLFGGSGSTLIGAHVSGRRAALMELAPEYVDVICRRFQEHTGIMPTREGVPHDFTVVLP